MIIQDLQNDVIMEGGAFADPGRAGSCAPAAGGRQRPPPRRDSAARGVVIIHVWFIVEPGAPGVTLNAPLFEGLVDSNAMVRGSWGAAPVSGLEPRAGDFVVEKMRMSAWKGTRLETILKATGRDMIINTGAWTNMSVEHTARTGADKGYFMIVPGRLLLDHERRLAQRLDQLCDAERRRRHQRGCGHQGAGMTSAAMPKLLHLSCSPRADLGIRLPGAKVFIDRFRQAHPDWDIDVMNLWRDQLPEFEGYGAWRPNMPASAGGRSTDAAAMPVCRGTERMALRFVARRPRADFDADVELRHSLQAEAVHRRHHRSPGLAFRFDPAQGYLPLFMDRPTVVILASGSDFITGMNRGRIDMATPYLREVLRFIGINDVRFVAIGPTAGPRQSIEAARDRASKRLAAMAANF